MLMAVVEILNMPGVCASLATALFLALPLVAPTEGHQIPSPDNTNH